MDISQLRTGEMVEYKQHPVEVVGVDDVFGTVVVWDERSQKHLTLTGDDLKDDPQCHCDSYLYY